MRFLIIAITLLVTSCEYGVDQSTIVKPNYDILGDCDRPDLAMASAIIADSLCGKIEVAENPLEPNGRKISLNIMLLPATSSVVRTDPIFFIAGGPGQSAVDSGVFVFTRLNEIRRERDIVLVDQRGTGRSNPLECDLEETNQNLQKTTGEILRLALAKLKSCLSGYDANPSYYTTPIAMDDLNQVRQQLGYRKINLLGVSYGTRASLIYMRQHPSTVRSAILDGLAPPTMRIPANIAKDANAAFSKLLADCRAQAHCNKAFPRLAEHFDMLTLRLQEGPKQVTFTHPRTGEYLQGHIDAKLINGIIRNVLYDRVLSTLVPFAIEEAYSGNYQPFASLAQIFAPEEPIINIAMMASVLCAEDMRVTNSANSNSRFDNHIYDLLDPICEFWPRGEIPENYFQPVSSDVPTLLLSGALDPVTPPQYGWEAAKTLANSQHIVVEGVGHGVSLQGCVPKIITDFFSNPVPTSINASCASNLNRKEFFTSFAGPVPTTDSADD